MIKLCHLSDVKFVGRKEVGAFSFMVRTMELFIPLTGNLDSEEEISRIEGDLNYLRGFLDSVMKKLGNEKFASNAPAEVLERERKKRNDTEIKISSLEERLRELKSK